MSVTLNRKRQKEVKITKLQITIEPWRLHPEWSELRVKTEVNGTEHYFIISFEENDFDSYFDCLMEEAKKEIRRLVKAHEE